MRRLLLLPLLAIPLLLAGCGQSGADTYSRLATMACERADSDWVRISQMLDAAQGTERKGLQLELHGMREKELDLLSALSPPAEYAAAHADVVAEYEKMLQTRRKEILRTGRIEEDERGSLPLLEGRMREAGLEGCIRPENTWLAEPGF